MSLKPKLLADENIPRKVIEELRNKGYNILPIQKYSPGLRDVEVLKIAVKEKRIILTFDKDFGRLALTYPEVPGVILLRFKPKSVKYIFTRIEQTLRTVKKPYGKLIIVRNKTIKTVKLAI